jgi:hypothetical protein
LTPSPILKVLSSIQRNGVRALLMGGQSCVLYGGAEFSRDTDLVIVSDAANLNRLRASVVDLDAHPIAVGDPRRMPRSISGSGNCGRPRS